MSNENSLKCRFCDRRFPKFYRNKDGETRSGWGRLLDHVALEHENEYDKIQDEVLKDVQDWQVNYEG